MGTRSRFFNRIVATILSIGGLGLLLPARAEAINLRSTLAVAPVSFSPATRAVERQRSARYYVKGKRTVSVALRNATPVAPAAETVAPVHRVLPPAAATADRVHDFVEPGGAWQIHDRWGDLEATYSSLVASYLPLEQRLQPVTESLSLASSLQTEDFALGYSLSALGGSAPDSSIVRLQFLLGGRADSNGGWRPRGATSKAARGTRYLVDLARRWTLAVRGDARGLRMSGTSDLSWDLVGSVGRSVGELVEVRLGYRVSRLDARQTRGTLGLGRLVQGPQLGFNVRF